MKILIALVLFAFMGAGKTFAQIPAEWQAAAQAVIGDLERDTPLASKPWSNETTQGWHLARAWRKHNNGNIDNNSQTTANNIHTAFSQAPA